MTHWQLFYSFRAQRYHSLPSSLLIVTSVHFFYFLCSPCWYLLIMFKSIRLFASKWVRGVYFHIRAEAIRTPPVPAEQSQSPSKWVTRSLKWPKTHLWLWLWMGGWGGIRATRRSLPLTAQGATAGVLGCENITLARWYSPEYEYVSTKICYLF